MWRVETGQYWQIIKCTNTDNKVTKWQLKNCDEDFDWRYGNVESFSKDGAMNVFWWWETVAAWCLCSSLLSVGLRQQLQFSCYMWRIMPLSLPNTCNAEHQHHWDQKSHNGTIHSDFLTQSQTVNRQCYLDKLGRLHEARHLERSKLWPDA